jgi:large subunit ribosomal protein L17
MRHRVAGYKLGRDAEDRRALRRNLAAALFTHGQITTSLPKAKSVQPFVEKLITTARKGDLASRRRVIAALQDRIIVKNDTDEDVKRNKYG